MHPRASAWEPSARSAVAMSTPMSEELLGASRFDHSQDDDELERTCRIEPSDVLRPLVRDPAPEEHMVVEGEANTWLGTLALNRRAEDPAVCQEVAGTCRRLYLVFCLLRAEARSRFTVARKPGSYPGPRSRRRDYQDGPRLRPRWRRRHAKPVAPFKKRPDLQRSPASSSPSTSRVVAERGEWPRWH